MTSSRCSLAKVPVLKYRPHMPGFPERLKELRGVREDGKPRVSQEAAARLIGVGVRVVGSWESGARKPRTENLVSIWRVTGAPIEYILGESDDWNGTPRWWTTAPRAGAVPPETPADLEAKRAAQRLLDQDDAQESPPGAEQAS